jgi:hypothetical protein
MRCSGSWPKALPRLNRIGLRFDTRTLPGLSSSSQTFRHMKTQIFSRLAICLIVSSCIPVIVSAQGTLADYERARGLRSVYMPLAINMPGAAAWIRGTDHFWYRRTVKGGSEFVLVDAANLTRCTAFDHERLAASLSAASGEKYPASNLPRLMWLRSRPNCLSKRS